MTEQDFTQELEKIANEAWDKARALVHKAQKEDGLDWQTNRPVSWADTSPAWERAADSLANLTGWIYDRLNGKNRLSKNSMGKKIRKALGYTNP